MSKKMYETPEVEIHEIEIKTFLTPESMIDLAPARPDFDEEEIIDFNNLKLF